VSQFLRIRRDSNLSERPRRDDDGFGLIDVIVAFTILLIVMIPTVYLMSELGAQTSANSLSVTAGELAEQALENAGQIPLHGASGLLAALQGGPITTKPVVNGVTYTSVVNLSWSNIGSTKNLCSSGAPPQVILATAQVSWAGGSVTENTALNPPYGALVPTDGFVPIEVTGATNQAQGNIIVTVNDISQPVTNASSWPQTFNTDLQYGCAFIELPAGDEYSFTLSPPSAYTSTTYPYVSNQESLSPTLSTSAVVKPNGAVYQPVISFSYDISGSVALKTPSVTAVDNGVQCPTSSTCFAMGQSANSATLFTSSASSNWTNVAMPGSNTPSLLSSVACISSSQCYFAGSSTAVVGGVGTTSGAIDSASFSGGTWTLSNITPTGSGLTTTAFTSISCPGTGSCFADGTGTSGGTQVGIVASLSGSAWTVSSPTVSPATTTLSTLTSIACPTSAQCLAVGTSVDTTTNTGSTAETVFNFNAASGVLTVDDPTVSGASISSLTEVTCPATTNPTCFVTGSSVTSPATTSTPVLFVSGDVGATWTQTPLTGALTVGTISCGSSSLCMVPASLASGGSGAGDTSAVYRLSLTAGSSPTAWTQTASTSASGFVAGTACTSATACVDAGQSGSAGFLSSGSGGTTWSPLSLSAQATPGYFTGIACSGNGGYCVASGEGPSGDLLDSTTTPATGSSWTAAPASLFTSNGGGQNVLGLPVSYTQSSLSTLNVAVHSQTGNPPPPLVSPLYPYPTAYSLFYGDCADEASAGSAATATVTSSRSTNASIGIGTLAVEVVDANGQPITGAQISVTTSDGSCPTDTFQLPSTGASGISQAGVINTPVVSGTAQPYTVTVTSGAHTYPVTTLAVSASGVVATTSGLASYYHYPNPVVIEASS
jgi:hypothetical protein